MTKTTMETHYYDSARASRYVPEGGIDFETPADLASAAEERAGRPARREGRSPRNRSRSQDRRPAEETPLPHNDDKEKPVMPDKASPISVEELLAKA